MLPGAGLLAALCTGLAVLLALLLLLLLLLLLAEWRVGGGWWCTARGEAGVQCGSLERRNVRG